MKLFLLLTITLLLVNVYLGAQTEHGIYYSDGTFIQGNPRLHEPFLKERYFTLNDTLVIDILSVKAYEDGKGYYLSITDNFGRIDFGKRIVNGKISVYELYKINAVPMGGTGNFTMTYRPVYHFTTTKDFYIYKYNMKTLEPILAENPNSKKYVDKYYSDRGWYYMGFVGMAIGGIGALSLSKDKDNNRTGISLCLGFSAICYISTYINGANSEFSKAKAVEEYNKTP
jgi:hypothetical protein